MSHIDTPLLLAPDLQVALLRLIGTYRAAGRNSLGLWHNAPTGAQLFALGVTPAQLENLLGAGLICRQPGAGSPDHPATLLSWQRSRFALTAAGRPGLKGLIRTYNAELAARAVGRSASTNLTEHVRPHWQEKHRQLWFGLTLVKALHRTAGNQDPLLTALEQANWVGAFNDPLEHDAWDDREEQMARFGAAVKNLNRGHRQRLLRFHVVRGSRQIVWKLLP